MEIKDHRGVLFSMTITVSDLGQVQAGLPEGSVWIQTVTLDGRVYNVYRAPDGSIWVQVPGGYRKWAGQPPTELQNQGGGQQQQSGGQQPQQPGGPPPTAVGETEAVAQLSGSASFDDDADTAALEFTVPGSQQFDASILESRLNVQISLLPDGSGNTVVRLDGSINGVLAAAMFIGVERVHGYVSEWGMADVVLNRNVGMAFIDLNGEPYQDIVLHWDASIIINAQSPTW